MDNRVTMKALNLFGIGVIIALAWVATITILWAGLFNDMTFSIAINCYGEGWIEMVIAPLATSLGTWRILDETWGAIA